MADYVILIAVACLIAFLFLLAAYVIAGNKRRKEYETTLSDMRTVDFVRHLTYGDYEKALAVVRTEETKYTGKQSQVGQYRKWYQNFAFFNTYVEGTIDSDITLDTSTINASDLSVGKRYSEIIDYPDLIRTIRLLIGKDIETWDFFNIAAVHTNFILHEGVLSNLEKLLERERAKNGESILQHWSRKVNTIEFNLIDHMRPWDREKLGQHGDEVVFTYFRFDQATGTPNDLADYAGELLREAENFARDEIGVRRIRKAKNKNDTQVSAPADLSRMIKLSDEKLRDMRKRRLAFFGYLLDQDYDGALQLITTTKWPDGPGPPVYEGFGISIDYPNLIRTVRMLAEKDIEPWDFYNISRWYGQTRLTDMKYYEGAIQHLEKLLIHEGNRLGESVLKHWSRALEGDPFTLGNRLRAKDLADLNCTGNEVPISIFCFSSYPGLGEYAGEMLREAENLAREEMGIPRVGEGWVSETMLFNEVREKLLPLEVLHHASPEWLGRQHLDIFIPELKVAIEYQGRQHSEPVDFFGGEEKSKKTRERDKRKLRLCQEHGISLLYVEKGYDIKELISDIQEAGKSQADID